MIEIRVPKMDAFGGYLNRGFDVGQLERDASRVVALLRADVDVASEVGDRRMIDRCTERYDRAAALLASTSHAVASLEDAERKYRELCDDLIRASAQAAMGTLDKERAIADEADRIAASAAERWGRSTLVEPRSRVQTTFTSIIKMERDDVGKVRDDAFTDTEAIANQLFAKYNPGDAWSIAQKFGRTRTAAHAEWWPLAEHVVAKAFKARLKTEVRELRAQGYDVSDLYVESKKRRRGEPVPELASMEELADCFATRREAYLRAAREAEETASAMRGPEERR